MGITVHSLLITTTIYYHWVSPSRVSQKQNLITLITHSEDCKSVLDFQRRDLGHTFFTGILYEQGKIWERRGYHSTPLIEMLQSFIKDCVSFYS